MTARIRFSVCMALLSILINTWPVPINGRTFRERDETNSDGLATENRQLCHHRLKEAMQQVCPHGFYTPESVSSNRNRNRREFSGTENNGIISRRFSRSIVDECCHQACNATLLIKYCRQTRYGDSAVQSTEPSSTMATPTTTRQPKAFPYFRRWVETMSKSQPETELVWQPASIQPREATLIVPRPFRHRLQARDTSDVSSSYMRFRTFQQRLSSAESGLNRTNGGHGRSTGTGRTSLHRRTLPDTGDNELSSGVDLDQGRDNYPSSIQIVTEEAFPEPVALSMGLNDQFYVD